MSNLKIITDSKIDHSKSFNSMNNRDMSKQYLDWKSTNRNFRKQQDQLMDKVIENRTQKKIINKHAKEKVIEIARKIPIEILVKDWFSDNKVSIELRTYLVDKLMPTLVLGVEKLLKEVDKKELTENKDTSRNFNPINFLAKYLLRNNPRYSNFSETSPYVHSLRVIAEELRAQLFTKEENRLAWIKAETVKKRKVRERKEQDKKEQEETRGKQLLKQFMEWTSNFHNKLQLSFVQSSLVSFKEVSLRFSEDLRERAKFKKPLKKPEEIQNERYLDADEYVAYIESFTESFEKDIFDKFLNHLAKCAQTYLSSVDREKRRITLTNLFHFCDETGIGLLDRNRTLKLFQDIYDNAEKSDKLLLNNPRRWPVLEVEEVQDDYFGEEYQLEDEKSTKFLDDSLKQVLSELDNVYMENKVKLESEVFNQFETTELSENISEQLAMEKTELSPATQYASAPELRMIPKVKGSKLEDSENVSSVGEEQQKASSAELFTEEAKMDASFAESSGPIASENVTNPEQISSSEKKSDVDDGKKEDSNGKTTPEVHKARKATFADHVASGESLLKDSEKVVSIDEEQKDLETDQKTNDLKEPTTEKLHLDEDAPEQTLEPENKEKIYSKSRQKFESSEIEEKMATMIAERIRSGLSLTSSQARSQVSAFNKATLNISQFVQLVETFLGDDHTKEIFEHSVKYIEDNYEEDQKEKANKVRKANLEVIAEKKKIAIDNLFGKWDIDRSGFLNVEDVEEAMLEYKGGQESDLINSAKEAIIETDKSHDHRLSKQEFREMVQRIIAELPGVDEFEQFLDFLSNRIERTYFEMVRSETRKKWLLSIIKISEINGAQLAPSFIALFQALYKDAEAHGDGKKISAYIALLEHNVENPERGDVLLRYVAATVDHADSICGKALYKDMKGISFAAIEAGKPVHVPRIGTHGNIHFWNTERNIDNADGSLVVVPLKDNAKRVFGVLGIDTLNDLQARTIFLTHEIHYYQGVAKAFSIAYHNVCIRKRIIRIATSAARWIHFHCPHVAQLTLYMVEPDPKIEDYVLRKMMSTDDTKGKNVTRYEFPDRLERTDSLFRDYLFKCVDNSETISADAYGQRHLAYPLRSHSGLAIFVLDINIAKRKNLPNQENSDLQQMLKLLHLSHEEVTRELRGGVKSKDLEVDEYDNNMRIDVMFDRLMLTELRKKVAKLNNQAYAELKSYLEPPKIVHKVLQAVLSIFYPDESEKGCFLMWEVMKNYINPELNQMIANYDPTESKTVVPVELIEKFLCRIPHGAVAKFGSLPAQYLYNWLSVCVSLFQHIQKQNKIPKKQSVLTRLVTL